MKTKKFAAAGLAALMAVSAVPAMAFADGEPEITMMVTDHSGNSLNVEGSQEVIDKVTAYTGVKVNFNWVENGNYDEIFGTTLLDRSNMPMILTAGGSLTSNIVNAANQGAFWDLTDYLADSASYPNLSQADANVLKGLTVNGQIIGVYRAREIGRYGLSYRKDWAEKVGITEDPKTIDDVYDMLDKFTHNDPDGNGVDDTYGLEMCKYTGPFDIIETWFGVGNGWTEKDGELVPVHETEEYMEALNWIKKCFDDGLMRPDFATIDTSEWSNGTKKGEAGVYIDVMDGGRRIWDYYNTENVESVMGDGLASMALVGPIEGHTLATSGYNGFYMITKDGAKTEDDVKNCLTFLDKMCDDEMMELADFGIEGVTYTINDAGNVEYVEGYDQTTAPQTGLNQTVAYIPNLSSTKHSTEKTERLLAQEEAYERTRPVAVANPALGYLANSATYSVDGGDLDTVISEARTQYICGAIDEAGLKAKFQEWSDKGGAKVKEEVNAQYQEDIANGVVTPGSDDAAVAEDETETAAE